MYFQLESLNARPGCDNSRLPKVQLSIGAKGFDLKKETINQMLSSNLASAFMSEERGGEQMAKKIQCEDNPIINAFRGERNTIEKEMNYSGAEKSFHGEGEWCRRGSIVGGVENRRIKWRQQQKVAQKEEYLV